MLTTVSRCALLGAAAALLVALGDFGASWLWLADPLDRFELGLRAFAIVVPLGALAGALLGGFASVSRAPMQRLEQRCGPAWRARLWPAPFVLLASPGLVLVASLLFSGGSASKLPMRPFLVALAALLLASGLYAALRVGRALVLAAPSLSRGRATWLVLVLLLVHLGLAKVDQMVLPGLYGYLHALVGLASWFAAALALAVLALRSPRIRALDRRAPALGLTSLLVLLGVFIANVGTLGMNQTVRVALLSPRAAATRSLMRAIGPALTLTQSRAAAEAAALARRARAERGRDPKGGVVVEGAHVLLVTIDALRADHLGLYGYRRRPVSANLDRFAEESIVFETAYATAPHSSYSLCSLMASDYLYQRISLGLPVPTETIASVLRQVGYHTSASYIQGIFHTDGAAMERFRASSFGFGQASHRNLDAKAKTDELLGELDRIVEAGEPPSFVWTHYFDVHEPYEDTFFGTTDIERYDGEIRKVDREFGRLIREARARLTRPLIIVVTADHGEEFRDHGGVYHGSTVYQEQIRVPLIMHVPGAAPRRVSTPVELIDVAPSLLGLLGVPVAPSMQGNDLRPLFASDDADRGPVFGSAGTKHMVVDWPHKLIVDLRFGTIELYGLDEDPRERENLADARPELVRALRGELQAWLDSLSESAHDPHDSALYRGRLADSSAAPALGALLLDERAALEKRLEAARLLTKIQHEAVEPALRRAANLSNGANDEVAAEALIALAWLGEGPSRRRLRAMLEDRALDRRVRAAVGLGRLRDRAAVPVLVEAIEDERIDERTRFEAIRLLGELGDRDALEPLLELLGEMRTRRRAVLALGHLGDLRAFDPLVEQLLEAQHTTVRESSARALAYLGDGRAVPHLIQAALNDRLPSVGEALVRLRAVNRAVGGLDVRAGVRGEGLGQCRSLDDAREDATFLARTYCEGEASRMTLPLALPRAVREAGSAVLLLRARRLDAGASIPVRVGVGDHALPPVRFSGEWSEARFTLQGSQLAPTLILEVDGEARLAIDHALLIPSP